MFNQDFCEFLEHEVNRALEYTDDDQLRGFWCDGVLLFGADSEYEHASICNSRVVRFRAFLGRDGQQEYELTLRVGNKALSRLSRGFDIRVCFPNWEEGAGLEVDLGRRKVFMVLL